MLRTLGAPFAKAVGRYLDDRKRRHTALAIGGALVASLGLLGYGLVWAEIPFAEAKVTSAADLQPGDIVKVYGRIECSCTKAIDREEVPVGATGRTWEANFSDFAVRDPSGAIHIDSESVTRLTAGPTGGDWMNGDRIAVYGTVYDQGHGAIALRAQTIAKTPDDTPAVWSFHFLVVAALGAVLILYVITDRWFLGAAE